jgi:hypothetical protein
VDLAALDWLAAILAADVGLAVVFFYGGKAGLRSFPELADRDG